MAKSYTIYFIGFDEIFNEPLLEREQYFNDLPKKGLLLTFIMWLNDYKLTGGNLETRSKNQIQFLYSVLKKSEYSSCERLKEWLQIEQQNKFKLIWITQYTCLEAIEYLLSNYSEIIFDSGLFDREEASNEQEQLTDKQILKIIKGYFAFAHSRIIKLKSSFDTSFRTLVRRQFAERIGTYELERSDDFLIFYVEILKSIEFFQFLESSYKELLHHFLVIKGLKDWQEYVLKISGFMYLFNSNIKVRVSSGTEKDRDIHFFNSFVSCEDYLKPSPNFLSLKKFPLLKYDHNAYLLIFRTFVFEKIYKTLYFEVQEVARKKEIKLSKSDLGKKFFEEWLCSRSVNKIFNRSKIINLEDTNPIFQNTQIIPPDHYIRNWNDIFIFEYKDVLISDSSKIAYDKENVLNELYLKLVKKSSGKKSALLQLAKFIIDYSSSHKIFDPYAKTNRITFYPILIVQDRCLSTPGINQILNDWFKEIFENDSNLGLKTKRLVIINIDCIINYTVLFEGNPIAFKKCILEYLKFESKAEEHGLIYSFDIWMRREYLHKENRREKIINFIQTSYYAQMDKLNSIKGIFSSPTIP